MAHSVSPLYKPGASSGSRELDAMVVGGVCFGEASRERHAALLCRAGRGCRVGVGGVGVAKWELRKGREEEQRTEEGRGGGVSVEGRLVISEVGRGGEGGAGGVGLLQPKSASKKGLQKKACRQASVLHGLSTGW